VSSAQRDRERHAALASLFKAHRTYQTRSFLVDRNGQHWGPLHTAERYGWCWFQDDRCAITHDGRVQMEPYLKTEPRPCVQWICPVCMGVVEQLEDEAGMPENTPCPTCQKLTREQVEAMLTRQQRSA
jgi:hypothetical protein